jgi:hypothetical protein
LNSYVPKEDTFVSSVKNFNVGSMITKDFYKKPFSFLQSKFQIFSSKRRIKSQDPDFEEEEFLNEMEETYKNAYSLLSTRDPDIILEHMTENAFAKIWKNMKFKTMKWEFIETIEPSRIVNIVSKALSKNSTKFVQATVRFHTKQVALLVYQSIYSLNLIIEFHI